MKQIQSFFWNALICIVMICFTSCTSDEERAQSIVQDFLEAVYTGNESVVSNVYKNYVPIVKMTIKEDPSHFKLDSITRIEVSEVDSFAYVMPHFRRDDFYKQLYVLHYTLKSKPIRFFVGVGKDSISILNSYNFFRRNGNMVRKDTTEVSGKKIVYNYYMNLKKLTEKCYPDYVRTWIFWDSNNAELFTGLYPAAKVGDLAFNYRNASGNAFDSLMIIYPNIKSFSKYVKNYDNDDFEVSHVDVICRNDFYDNYHMAIMDHSEIGYYYQVKYYLKSKNSNESDVIVAFCIESNILKKYQRKDYCYSSFAGCIVDSYNLYDYRETLSRYVHREMDNKDEQILKNIPDHAKVLLDEDIEMLRRNGHTVAALDKTIVSGPIRRYLYEYLWYH